MKQTKQTMFTRPKVHSRRSLHAHKSNRMTGHGLGIAALAGCFALGLSFSTPFMAKAGVIDDTLAAVMDTEFTFNKSNEVIGAHHAYAQGITGKGINVAIADTGVFLAPYRWLELKNHIKREFNFYDANIHDVWNYKLHEFAHGQAIATIAVGKKNGFGGQGIAYDATVNSYRISSPRSALAPKSPAHVAALFARLKTDKMAVMSGAWGWMSTRDVNWWDPAWIRRAMKPFADQAALLTPDGQSYRGTALVFATGNNATPDPSNLMALVPHWFPELQSKFLAVTGVDVTNWQSGDDVTGLQRASFASACGVAKDWCVAAPALGVRMMWPNQGTSYIAGTSFATAATTGAIALLMQAFPEISAEQAIAIILETATDIGAPGVDEIFGHGLVNLEAALQPVGDPTLTVDGVTSTAFGNVMETSSLLGSGFSAALAQTSLTFEDKFGRHFSMSLDQVARSQTRNLDLAAPSFASFRPQLIETPQRGIFLTAAGGTLWRGDGSTQLAFGSRSDKEVVPAGALPFDHMDKDAIAGVLSLNSDGRGTVHLGAVDTGKMPSLFAAYRYQLDGNVNWVAGSMLEQNGLHGNHGNGLFAFDGYTTTLWTGLNGAWQLGSDTLIEAEAMAGYLRFDGADGQVTQALQGAMTSASVSLTQRNAFADGDRLQLSIGLPATLLNGSADMRLPYRGETVDRSLSFSNKPAVEMKAVWAVRF